MTYIITCLCRDCLDTGCVAVCPVDCVYQYTGEDRETFPNQLYIHPEECIDCGACEPECPWQAIFEEEAAGKNPVSHVGKIYSVLAHLLATRLHAHIPGLREVMVWLCSHIDEPVDQPQIVSVQVHLQPGVAITDVVDPIQQVVKEELAHMPVFCQELVQGRYSVC